MIYSLWVPDRGGYQYFEVPERRGLGDDLPVPRLAQSSPIGVASTSIGRTIPLSGKLVGAGPLAKGSVAPLDRTGLSGGDVAEQMTRMLWVGAAALVGLWAGWYWRGKASP